MSKPPRKMSLPPTRSVNGWRQRGDVSVTTGKPPKLRFRPGDVVKHGGVDHVVICAYRVKAEPHEWYYQIEEQKPKDEMQLMVEAMGCGAKTPRIVYELFRDHAGAQQFFWGIPHNAAGALVSNKKLLQENPR